MNHDPVSLLDRYQSGQTTQIDPNAVLDTEADDPLSGLSEKEKFGLKGLPLVFHGSREHAEYSRGQNLSLLGLDYESDRSAICPG